MARIGTALGPAALAGTALVAVGGALYLVLWDGEAQDDTDAAMMPAVSAPANEQQAAAVAEDSAGRADAGDEDVAEQPIEAAPEEAAAALPEPLQEDQAQAPEVDTPDNPADSTLAPAVPDTPVAEAEATDADDAPPVVAPSFDLVRAEADGQLLVAGTAAPGHDLRLLVDGEEAATGAADASGAFVLFASLNVVDRPRVLDLVSVGPDGTEQRADESVILAPPSIPVPDLVAEVPEPEPVLDVPAPTASAAAAPVPVATLPTEGSTAQTAEVASVVGEPADAPQPSVPLLGASPVAPSVSGHAEPTLAEAPTLRTAEELAVAVEAAPEGATASASLVDSNVIEGTDAGPVAAATATSARAVDATAAPAVLRASASGVELLQPGSLKSAQLDRVVIDVISYDAKGVVTLEGRSAAPPPPIDRVRIYLDNAPIDTTPILDDGTWRMPLRDVEAGVYTLRVDQLDKSGNVVSRFETPFKREDPTDLARIEAERPEVDGIVDVSVITVQPGYTLWGIASDRYGDGFQYVAIFDANAGQIRNPDLIYPGQVFDLPDIEAPR